MNILGHIGHQAVGGPGTKVCVSSKRRNLVAGCCPGWLRLRDHRLVLQLDHLNQRHAPPLTCVPVETPIALQTAIGHEAVFSLQHWDCK